jgi:TatD DNase family protein
VICPPTGGLKFCMFIDTHCHLNFSDFDLDRNEVILRAIKNNIDKIIVPGVDVFSSKKSIELSKQYPKNIYSTIGFHPYESKHIHNIPSAIKILESLIDSSVVAIGECGLDYHQYNGHDATGKKYEQQQLFEAECLFALKHNLPLIIHCRDAFEDIYTVLDNLPSMPKGVFHCFTGGLTDIRMMKERNFFIGIDGNVTYSKHHQTMVPAIPLTNLLLETDSPYLTPIPNRGKRNEPSNLIFTASYIAKLKHASIEIIQSSTTSNAKQLFRLQ